MQAVAASSHTPQQRQLGLYFGLLLLTIGLAEPTGLVSLPLLFWLKNGLHLAPHTIALFDAVALMPMYMGFAFGFLRDRWRPFGRDDRGFLIIAAPIAIAAYCWIAGNPASWTRLLAGVIIAALSFECLGATTEAMMTAAAQKHLMTGRLSALGEIGEIVPSVVSMVVGGWMAVHFGAQTSFLIAAAATAIIAAQAFWRPPAVFSDEPRLEIVEGGRKALSRLMRHGPLWPAAIALFLWNVSPGWGTPLAFFLSDNLKFSAAEFGAFRAVGFAGGAVAALIYGVLCRHMPLRRILRWTILLNVLPAFLLLIATDAPQALAVSAIVGLLLGMLNIALFDLLRRSCPAQLEGTGVMLGYSFFALGGSVGDVLGSWMFERVGLPLCLAVDALATLAMFVVVWRVPDSVLASRDGEPEPTETSRQSVLIGQGIAA